ncbi:MAG: methionyl-tRNA formyltransferase [Bacteroidales bacterium]
MSKESLRIVFMGTPEYAVPSLELLIQSRHQVVAVVTVPDKPAGRGRQLTSSPVKTFAESKNIPVLTPEKLKDPAFLNRLQSCQADLFIVVAFRMLPREVWTMPPLGTFNLHASLLPQYRGAAPINWAIINGEKKTGITTFFIDQEIDTGRIIFQEEIPIPDNYTAGDLHDKMMVEGARLVLKTADAIATGNIQPAPQQNLIREGMSLHPAPKLFREHAQILWTKPGKEICNLIRGLSPYPGAFTLVETDGTPRVLKIYEAEFVSAVSAHPAGILQTDPSGKIVVSVADGIVQLLSVQLEGKKRMPASEFLRGIKTGSTLKLSTSPASGA